ncbi:hypothetical protein EV702DRAFT_1075407 [Suillus placidus]|uniref:Uncharacterized protein n=1 Tax=Suillus placidus TaxID=48579 RepID=A0A9P7A2S4_9AGAM|nr:hypothetical protein EV702DRAFT_1075407 [Suillus placidus]
MYASTTLRYSVCAGIAWFIPDSAKASTGADGSIGGLGTHDTINSGPQLSGIQFGNMEVKVDTTTTRRTCEHYCRRDGRPKSPLCTAGWGYGLGASDRFYSRSSQRNQRTPARHC